MKSVSLVVAIVALLGTACTVSDGKTAPADGGNNGGMDGGGTNVNNIPIPTVDSGDPKDSAPPNPYPDCDRAMVNMRLAPPAEPWDKPKPWNMAAAEACAKLCQTPSFKCISDMCEKGMDFVSCYIAETSVCATDGANAPCTTAWENVGCCAVDEGCFDTQAEFQTCTGPEGACGGAIMTYFECSNGDGPCGDAAAVACIGEVPEGGVPEGGTPDASAGDGGTTLSFDRTSRWLMDLPRQVNGSIRLPTR